MSRAERIQCAALAVVPGPGSTVTFVHQSRGPYAGHWLLPGGKVEIGETTEETARREVFEEAGCRVGPLRLFGVYEFLADWDADAHHLLMFGYAADRPVVADGRAGRDVGGIRQARPDEIELHSTDLRILTDAGFAHFDDDQIDKALTADGITMIAHRVTGSTVVRPDERG